MSRPSQRREQKERFWRALIQRWQRSGLSVRQYCDAHQIAVPTFYAWRRILAQRERQTAAFIPVRIVAEPKPAGASAEEGFAEEGLELLLQNGRRLRIGPAFDAATLQRLLAVLEGGRS